MYNEWLVGEGSEDSVYETESLLIEILDRIRGFEEEQEEKEEEKLVSWKKDAVGWRRRAVR